MGIDLVKFQNWKCQELITVNLNSDSAPVQNSATGILVEKLNGSSNHFLYVCLVYSRSRTHVSISKRESPCESDDRVGDYQSYVNFLYVYKDTKSSQ